MLYARTSRAEHGGNSVIVTKEILDSDEFAALFLHCKNARAAKAEILNQLAEEPGDGYVWTEQDIFEQMRKIIDKYE